MESLGFKTNFISKNFNLEARKNKQKNPQFSNTLLDIYQKSIALMKRKFYSLLFKFVAVYEVSKKNVTNSIDLRNMQDNYIL